MYVFNLELITANHQEQSIFYNKLSNNIKQISNNNQFKKELKGLLNHGCYYSIED
jgi:hypothetical protein